MHYNTKGIICKVLKLRRQRARARGSIQKSTRRCRVLFGCLVPFLFRLNTRATQVAVIAGVIGVIVFAVQVVNGVTERLAEALIVDDFALAQELNDVAHVGVIHEPQNVIVGHARLLLGGEVLVEVGNRVALDLQIRGGKRLARGGGGIGAHRVVHEVFIKAARLDLLGGEVTGQLMDDGGNHLRVPHLIIVNSGYHSSVRRQVILHLRRKRTKQILCRILKITKGGNTEC